MSSLAGSDSVDLRLCPSHLFHHTYVLNQPPASLHCPLLFHTHGCHILFLTRKRSKQPCFQLNFSYGPRLHFRYASKYPHTKEALGLWFPFGPYFVKQRRVLLCFFSDWFRGLLAQCTVGLESIQTCRSWETSNITSDLSKSLLYMSWS